jgi:hypothetical protein
MRKFLDDASFLIALTCAANNWLYRNGAKIALDGLKRKNSAAKPAAELA